MPHRLANDVEPADFALAVHDIFVGQHSSPLGWLDFRILTLPFGDTRKLREVIPYELDNLILVGSAQVVFDVAAVTPSSGGSFDVLVAFIRKDVLKAALAFLGARGFDPRVITSLDLRAMLRSDAGSLAERLLAPPQLTQDEKVETAKKEIAEPTIDLRQGELRYTRATRKKAKQIRATALLLIVLAVVLHAYLAAENRSRETTDRRSAPDGAADLCLRQPRPPPLATRLWN